MFGERCVSCYWGFPGMSVVDVVVVVWLYYYGSIKKQVIISPKTNRHKIKRFDLRSACPRQNLSQFFLSSAAVVIIDQMPLFLGHSVLF